MVLMFALILVSLAEGRYYRIQTSHPGFDWVRGKRQSHPDVTEARLPAVPFQPSPPADQPSSFVPFDYLTPPAAQAPKLDQGQSTVQTQLPPQPQPPPPIQQQQFQPVQQITPSQQQIPLQQNQAQNSEKWELGYDAGELLVPPVLENQNLQYDSLKLQQSNIPPEIITISPLNFTPGEIQSSYEPDSAASEISGRKYRSIAADPRYLSDNRPVYSFVKTDPHGHFKWGVHIGH